MHIRKIMNLSSLFLVGILVGILAAKFVLPAPKPMEKPMEGYGSHADAPHISATDKDVIFQTYPTPVAGARPDDRYMGFDIHNKYLGTCWTVFVHYKAEDRNIVPGSATAKIYPCDLQ